MNHIHHSNNKPGVMYTCPMHPAVQQEKPGRCPECGMNLIKSETHKGHDKHARHHTEDFLKKFWVSLILTVPVVLYADVFQRIFRWSPPDFSGSAYLPLSLGSVVFFYGGWVFLAGAWRELRARLPGMMTLIGIAISAAYLYSVAATFLPAGHTLFWELTTLITIMLVGHWLEMRAVSGAQSALKELSKLLPDTAEVIRNGKPVAVPLGELREGDRVFVRPGGRIPADGVVREGHSDVNEAMVSGESAPLAKKPGSEVVAGTVNGDGSLTIEVTKVGERTFLAGVMRLVAEAQASKSRLQILSDRAAFYLTLVAVGTGGLTFLLWVLAKAGVGFALERLVAVLVIACPHALGLAVPLVASISTTLAARHGFLVRSRLSLELARNINTVLFDKTGTLTTGEYGVTNVVVLPQTHGTASAGADEILRLAASVDQHSEHFAARSIVREAEQRRLLLLAVQNFKRLPGRGVEARVGNQWILVGGAAILETAGAKTPLETEPTLRELAKQGKTLIYVLADGIPAGVIALADLIRPESRDAIRALKELGVRVAMLTGDSAEVAAWVAAELGVDEYFARVLPQEKSEKVKILQSVGARVAMVGDGINDAPALTQADVGIAIGAGTNVAIESAGIILVRNDPRDIPRIIRLSRLTYSKMIQNLFWATGYNIVALPLAAGILVSKGILLQPALAAAFMSLSTVIVAINALLLKRNNL